MLSIVTVSIILLGHIICSSSSSSGDEITFTVWTDKQVDDVIYYCDDKTEQNLIHYQDGDVVEISEEDAHVLIACHAPYPVIWSVIELHDKVVQDKANFSITGHHKSPGREIYRTKLTLWGNPSHHAGRYKCEAVDKSSAKSITVYAKGRDHDDTHPLLLNTGKKFLVTPMIGDTKILLPCHLTTSQSSDVYVEKQGRWAVKSRAVDIPFDPVLDGFVIDTTGEVQDISKYVGVYRCVQAGYEDFVEIEILTPIAHKIDPEENLIVVGLHSPIQVSCSSPTHVKLSVVVTSSTKNTGHVITTHKFRPNETFAHVEELIYYPTGEEGGEIRCELKNGEIIQKWQYSSVRKNLVLSLSEDQTEVECVGINTTTTPEIAVNYFKSYSEILLANMLMHHIHQDSQQPAFLISNNCREKELNCGHRIRPLRTGGLTVTCRVDGIIKTESFFVDVNKKLYHLRKKIPLDKMVKIWTERRSENQDLIVKCRWSPFFLTENAFFTSGSEILHKYDLNPSEEDGWEEISLENAPLIISCNVTLWHKNKVVWTPELFTLNLEAELLSQKISKSGSSNNGEGKIMEESKSSGLLLEIPTIASNFFADCTNSLTTVLLILIVSLVGVIFAQSVIIYQLTKIIPKPQLEREPSPERRSASPPNLRSHNTANNGRLPSQSNIIRRSMTVA